MSTTQQLTGLTSFQAPTASYPPSAQEVTALIQRFAPIMVLHPNELYLPDDPDAMLHTGSTSLVWGLVPTEDDYDTFSEKILGTLVVSSGESLLQAVATAKTDPNASNSAFRYWLNIPDSLKSGNLARARAQVVVRHQNDPGDPTQGLVHLQFWMGYGFNGPGKFHVHAFGPVPPYSFDQYVEMDTAGRHYGDWEHVTMELEYLNGQYKLSRVYLSRHTFTIWLDASQLQRQGEQSIIFVARDSHAHYPQPVRYEYERVADYDYTVTGLSVALYDLSASGTAFDTAKPDHYVVVSSDLPTYPVSAPAWSQFDGRWGQYQKQAYTYHVPVFGISAYTFKEVACGPRGPLQHSSDFGALARLGTGATVVGGNPQVFVAGSDENLWVNWWDSSLNVWHWSNLGAVPKVTIDGPVGAVSSNSFPIPIPTNVFAFARGSDGNLLLDRWSPNAWTWSDLGLPGDASKIVGTVGATIVSGHPYAYVYTDNGHLWLKWWNGSVWGWQDQGTPSGVTVVGGVGVTVVGGGPYAYVLGSDGHVWLNWWHDSSYRWQDQGMPPSGAVSVGAGVLIAGGPQAFVLGRDKHLWVNWWNQNQSAYNWTDLGTPSGVALEAPIGATPLGNGHPYVAFQGSDRHLWSCWWSGSAWAWFDQGLPPSGTVARGVGAVLAGGNPQVYVINSHGQLCISWWNGQAWVWNNQGSLQPS